MQTPKTPLANVANNAAANTLRTMLHHLLKKAFYNKCTFLSIGKAL